MSLEKKTVIIQRILTDKTWRRKYALVSPLGKLLPDSIYLKLLYKSMTGKSLNLKKPQTFNEKLQWLKLHDRKSIYTTMVDKYLAKEYVAGILGREYIIPTLGVWDRFDDINFDELPEQFVLKTTNDSGSIIICREKSMLDIPQAKRKLEYGLNRNYYYNGREWPYKNVKRRIIAEKYMADRKKDGMEEISDRVYVLPHEEKQISYEKEHQELKDYKFYCFNGEPEFLYLSQGLDNHSTARISYVTLGWEKEKFHRLDYAEFETLPPRPDSLDKMIELARILSKDIPFVRVDFYDINNQIYFGELTFYPGGGHTPFEPEEYDMLLGKLLKLPVSMKR